MVYDWIVFSIDKSENETDMKLGLNFIIFLKNCIESFNVTILKPGDLKRAKQELRIYVECFYKNVSSKSVRAMKE